MHIIIKYLCVFVLFFENFTICAKINEHQAFQNQTLKIRQIMKMAQEYRVRRANRALSFHPHDEDKIAANNTINHDDELEDHPNQKTNTSAVDGLGVTISTATFSNVTYNDHVDTISTTTESDESSENELTTKDNELSGNRTAIMNSGNNTSSTSPSQSQAPSPPPSPPPPPSSSSSSSSSAFSRLFSAASPAKFTTATTFKVTAPSSSIVTTKSSSSLTETNVKARRRTTTTTTKPFIPSSTSTTLLKSALTQTTVRATTVPVLSFSHKLTKEPELKTDDITLHPCTCDDNSLSGNFYTGSSVASATVGGVFLGAFTMILIFYIRGKCRRHFNGDYRRVPIEYDFELNPNLRHR